MRPEIEKIIEKELKKYEVKSIKIEDKANNKVYNYNLHIFSKDEDLNLFEGFLFGEVKEKSELSRLISRYRAPVSGYVPRLSLLIYDNQLLIKDYRRNKLIRKTIKKINQPFILKLKKALSEPNENNFNKLFDRTDIIEEFYILYKKARDFLLKNIKGISGEERREEFVDNLMMQMLTLWYLQERRFFNNDTSYFITKFKELKQKKLFNGFNNYYEFLRYFFNKIGNHLNRQYYEDKIVGKVVVVGPAIFLNGEHDSKAISIPDKCFYKEGMTDLLITTQPKKVGDEVPLLNLFESRDWTEGNIDEFVLGAIYEKLITYMERKKLGAYYTPEEITSYICKNTIEPYLIDRVNEKFGENFESIDQIIESENKEILSYLFVQLKEIKILDPAVGSAHFLESAINVLVSIYEKLWNKAKEMGLRKGLEILAADDCGRIKTINLLEISDEEQFKLYVKFFIILSKNIYGVDINPSALKVAKARLFLTLAKHFDIHKNYFIRFPNVHFNLREGNSLIGYVELKKEEEKKGQLGLEFSVREEEATYITEAIKPVKDKDLRKYLIETAHALGINGNIVKEIEDLNKILSKKEIKWNDFEFVLRTKEKLIRILIASLNSQYARPLNEILNQITKLFNGKLDEMFSKEYSIKLGELKKIKTFHWVFEFPEVFLDREGFDVVVGNPPHGDILNPIEKKWVKHNQQYSKPNNIAGVFLERTFNLVKFHGRIGYVIPKSIGFYSNWADIRKLILYYSLLECILDVGIGFVGVISEQLAIIVNKIPEEVFPHLKNNLVSIYVAEPLKIPTYNKKIEYRGTVPQSFMQKHNVLIFRHFTNAECEIIEFIDKNSIKFREIYEEAFRGLYIPDKEKEKIKEGNITWIDKVPYVGRYYLTRLQKIELTNPIWIEVSQKILKPRLFFKVLRGKRLVCFIDAKGQLLTTEKLVNITLPKNSNYTIYTLMVIINSVLPSFYIQKMLFSGTTETSRVMDDIYVGEIPIPIKIHKQQCFEVLVHYLLFLNSTEERRTQLKEIINYFDCQIADSLVYELYFKEKFHEDGLYPEPKEYLLELVSKHLKPINYDRWAELYWKKQLDGNLTSQEEKELENLEKENLKTIEEVYNSLVNDKQIQKQIEKIKSHEWVKVIEGER